MKAARMKKELDILQSPPPGISCHPRDEDGSLDVLHAQIVGGDDTPYQGGVFKVEVEVPARYPFEPPKMRFVTPIYHPNIDDAGRICLDLLKMPPAGNWKPSLNISTVLTSLQLLMAQPNPDDGLMGDISSEFKNNRTLFDHNARAWTKRHAKPGGGGDGGVSSSAALSPHPLPAASSSG